MPYADKHSDAAIASRKRCARRYYEKNADRIYEQWRQWCKDNPKRRKAQRRIETLKNMEKSIAKIKAWKKADPERTRKSGRDYARRIREDFLNAYGHACACCGEIEGDFLTLDHIDNNGAKHRRELKCGGWRLYLWLRKQGWPKDNFRLLCWNCNSARGRFGVCPHESNRLRDTMREQFNEEVA